MYAISSKYNFMLKRINKQILELEQNPFPNFHKGQLVNQGRWHQLRGFIIGPPGSLYQNKKFEMAIIFFEGFPFKQPKARFLTKIYNPNIDGYLCFQHEVYAQHGLGSGWSPGSTLKVILRVIVSLLQDPTPRVSNCGNKQAREEYIRDYDEFVRKAKQYCQQYCEDCTDINL